MAARPPHGFLFRSRRKPSVEWWEKCMSDLLEMARAYAGIAHDAGGDAASISLEELHAVRQGFLVASAATSGVLLAMCGGDAECARVEMMRAHGLPASVLRRRSRETEEIVKRDGVPNQSQVAAHIAIMSRTADEIGVWIERKQTGAALN